ncbi:MAG: helix-turn-helix domain-containing protein [Actinomycetota bacterium]|nr:helix-turn-helix domain-containing protein [Actinomycetota bacterium]
MNEGDVTEQDAYLGAGEAARRLEVSPKTVSRWADKGLIPCVTTLGGHRRFRRSTVEQIRRDMYGLGPDDASG